MFILLFDIFYQFHVFAEIFFIFVFVFHSFQELKTESKLARTGINPVQSCRGSERRIRDKSEKEMK